MKETGAKTDLITISLSLSATPAIEFLKRDEQETVIPVLFSNGAGNFGLHLRIALHYESLSKIITGYLANRRFNIADGFIQKHVIINSCTVSAGERDNLTLAVRFSGSYRGIAYFSGRPVYNEDQKVVQLQELDYNLKTNDFLLKAAKWLFDKRIVSEIRQRTTIDVAPYYKKAEQAIHAGINREWISGLTATGGGIELHLTAVTAGKEHLSLQLVCNGQLAIAVAEQQ